MVRHDRLARRLLLLALLLNGLHFVTLAVLVPRLPQVVPLHVDGARITLLSGPPSRLFLPAIYGLLTWLLNGALGWMLYERLGRRTAAYVLWAGAAVVQVGAWFSLLQVLP